MGKPKGQSHRTKGNIKPSSSGRAANFLSTDNLVGFESLAGDLGYIPILKSLEEDTECLIDPHFKVALCKLSKRDVTTKLKALSEFSDLCGSSDITATSSVLPYWPRLYNKLSTDGDRRVREAIQCALCALVSAVGKSIAPHLKNIIGAWWIAQCDSYAPAASAAVSAFQKAFPTEDKRKKAVIFGQEQIIETLFTGMFVNVKAMSSESDDMDIYREIASSLGALACFLQFFEIGDNNFESSLVDKILGNAKIWKFAKHKSPGVRSAFYCVLSALCQSVPNLLETHKAVALRSVLCKLNEPNPLVSKAIWDAADQLMKTFPDWHEHVDVRKGFLPQLWGMLKAGFYGNARYICPYLLPAISKFPPTLAVIPVYEEFFTCLELGMECGSISKSASETNAVITATIECMQYILRKSVEACEVPDWEVANHVLKFQLFPLLEKSIRKNDFHSYLVNPLHQLIATTVGTLAEKSTTSTRPENLQSVCKVMWKFIFELGCSLVDKSEMKDDLTTDALDAYLKFLQAVDKACHKEETLPKLQKVKFDEKKQPSSHKSEAKSVPNSHLLEQFEKFLSDWIRYFISLDELTSCQTLSLLNSALGNFTSGQLLVLVANQASLVDSVQNSHDCAYAILKDLLVPLFNKCVLENSTVDARNTARALFSCVSFCNANHASEILNVMFSNFNTPNVCTELGQLLVSNAQNANENSYLRWLMDEQCLLVGYLVSLINTKSDESELNNLPEWELLSVAVEKKVAGKENTTIPVLFGKQALLLLKCSENQLSMNKGPASVYAWNHLVANAVENYAKDVEFIDAVYEHVKIGLKLLLRATIDDVELLAGFQDILNKLLQTVLLPERYLDVLSLEVISHVLHDDRTEAIGNIVNTILQLYSKHDLAAHHVVSWLLALIPSSDVFGKWHSSIDSINWIRAQSLLSGDCISLDVCSDNVYHEELSTKYNGKLGVILNAVVMGCQLFPEVFQIMTLHSFHDLFIESVFLNAVSDADDELTVLHKNLMKHNGFFLDICSKVIGYSVSQGGGWFECLGYLLGLSNPDIEDDLYQLLLDKQSTLDKLDSKLATVINVFIRLFPQNSRKDLVVNWLCKIVLSNDLCYAEDVKGECSMALGIICFVKLMQNEQSTGHKEKIESILQLIVEWKSDYPDLFLFDCDLKEVNNKQLLYNSAIAQFLQFTVVSCVSSIHNDMWDFYQCSTVSWMESVCSTCEVPGKVSMPVFMLLHAACKLLKALGDFLSSQSAIEDPTLPSTLTNEWKEFFEPAANVNLITIFMQLNSNEIRIHDILVICFFDCLVKVSMDSLESAAGRLKPYLYPSSSLSESVQTLLYYLCSVYRKPTQYTPKVQALSYKLLCVLIQNLFTMDDGSSIKEAKVPGSFIDVLHTANDAIQHVWDLFKFEEATKIDVHQLESDDDTEEELLIVETRLPVLEEGDVLLLLSCLFTLRLTVNAASFLLSENKSDYITSMNKDPVTNLENLLKNLWVILPDVPLVYEENNIGKKQIKLNMFEMEPGFTNTKFDLDFIQHLACLLYRDILSNMPVLIRSWFNNLDKLNRANVDSYTSRYVSPVICRAELKNVSQSKQHRDITVRSRLATREVVAKYEVMDASFEIMVQLAVNHPLTPVQVNTVKRVGVAATQWRYWILQMTMLLQHQNGTIMDALLLWKQKVDKRLDGLEECMICFSVVHSSNAQSLPKLECKTCHKKYHAECLYKWFDTSNQSTCPLCRTPMMFR